MSGNIAITQIENSIQRGTANRIYIEGQLTLATTEAEKLFESASIGSTAFCDVLQDVETLESGLRRIDAWLDRKRAQLKKLKA